MLSLFVYCVKYLAGVSESHSSTVFPRTSFTARLLGTVEMNQRDHFKIERLLGVVQSSLKAQMWWVLETEVEEQGQQGHGVTGAKQLKALYKWRAT